MDKSIKKCANMHFWIKGEMCPVCGTMFVELVEYRNGDCIACGQLCPDGGYCCTDPAPIIEEDFQFTD